MGETQKLPGKQETEVKQGVQRREESPYMQEEGLTERRGTREREHEKVKEEKFM